MPAKIFKNIVAVVNLKSSGVVASCGSVACQNLKPDNQEETNIVQSNRGEKNIKDVIF